MKILPIALLALLALLSVASASSVKYSDMEGDWAIIGAIPSSGAVACALMSRAPQNHDFMYLVSLAGTLKVTFEVKTSLKAGPVTAALVAGEAKPLTLTGKVAADGSASLRVKDENLKWVADLFSGEKPLKITFSQAGIPPSSIDVALDDGSDAMESMGNCSRRMLNYID